MQLSPHFSLAEATVTTTGLPNNPPELLMEEIRVTAWRMEYVRALFGGRAVVINSWFRSPTVNAAVGGADGSHHQFGYAVDFEVRGLSASHVADRLSKEHFPFDQIITYAKTNHVHVSWSPRMRRQRLHQ